MNRIFTELTPECEITARMYAQGYEKKEIPILNAGRSAQLIISYKRLLRYCMYVMEGNLLQCFTKGYPELNLLWTFRLSCVLRLLVVCCVYSLFQFIMNKVI